MFLIKVWDLSELYYRLKGDIFWGQYMRHLFKL